jgi:hypothetical protein
MTDDHLSWLDMRIGSGAMFILRRRPVVARAGVVAAVIGVLALTSLPGAGAASSASATVSRSAAATVSASAASTAPAEGDTKCVPSGTGGVGLKCTGTYSGNTAFDPWIPAENSQGQPQSQNLPASDPPTVTVSQTKNLTDQDVQINWSNFTPSIGPNPALGANSYQPNPTDQTLSGGAYFQVSIFECMGTNPAVSNNGSTGFSGSQCYLAPVGSSLTSELANDGPANGMLATTLDNSVPATPAPSSYSPITAYLGDTPAFNGGDPSTWTGQADFHVEAPTPRSKGGFFNKCGPSTPCSLVIDPNWGGTPSNPSNKPLNFTDTSDCSTHALGDDLGPSGASVGDILPGTPSSPGYAQQTRYEPLVGDSGACWAADRIVIPLSFTPTPNDCPNKTPQFYAEGSPMMQTQMLQWQAGWCTGPAPVTVQYTSNSETSARQDFLAGGQAVQGRTDMALVTLPADANAQQGSSRKFTYAPLANSGTGIAYYTDDGTTGSQINRMVLNPRLLAKLTTQSYTLQYGCADSPPSSSPPAPSLGCDPDVLHNPYSLFDDPEFVSLNKNCQPYGKNPKTYVCDNPAVDSNAPHDDFPPDNDGGNNNVQIGGFLPTVLESQSDMTYDLTDWIAANPDATEFLNGKTDPWGMHVNNNYLHVSYPTQVFDAQDAGYSVPVACSAAACATQQQDETMQASWNFQVDLDTIAGDLLTFQPTADEPTDECSLPPGISCTSTSQLNFVSPASSENFGSRALLSVLDLGDIATYDFPAAELVNAAGKAVGPMQANVEAAVNDMKTNPDGVTQYFNYASTDPKAYPLTMVDYAMVPTCGLSSSEASAIADFLTKAATTGQAQGEAPGDLAPGYYPLTAKQKAQTLTAAAEVKAQDCKTLPPDHTIGGRPALNDTTPSSSHHPAGTPSPGSTTPASGKKSPSSAATPADGTGTTPKAQTAAFGQKSADSGLAGLLLLLAIIVGALLLIGGPAAWAITATGKWPVVLRWLRPVQARLRPALAWLTGLVVRRA